METMIVIPMGEKGWSEPRDRSHWSSVHRAKGFGGARRARRFMVQIST
jgi:hypothetical protein